MDFKGQVTGFEYDSAERLSRVWLPAVIDPCTSEWSEPNYIYEYDVYGDIVSQRDPLGRQTIFIYDYLHNQTDRILPDNLTEYKEYDDFGRIIKSTDFKEQVSVFDYNPRGLLEYERHYHSETEYLANYPNNAEPNIQYNYDNLGRRVSTAIDSNTYGYQYDSEGRIDNLTSPQGSIQYEYYTTGRMKYARMPQSETLAGADTQVGYGYDAMGRLSMVTVDKRNGVVPSSAETTIYDYNAVGSLEGITYANGVKSTYIYDQLNRLTNLTTCDASQQVLSSYAYTLANNGMRTGVTENDGTICAWSYDNQNRLLSETYDAPEITNDYVQTYVYDLAGNRYSDTMGGDTVYYHYNIRDQLLKTSSDPAGVNTLASYQYDDNGSLSQKAEGANVTTYAYNLQNRLVSVNNGTVVVNYEYDPDGKRVKKQVVGGSTTNYLIDPQNQTGYPQVFKETTGSTQISYVIGSEILSQNVGTNSPQYLIRDGHSSVRQIANPSGVITGNYHFDAYGQLLVRSDTPATNILYVGQMLDSHLGFYDNWRRWYDPVTGRFNQADTFSGFNEDPLSLHKYLYANCNPVMYTDPTGEFSFSLGDIMSVQSMQKIFNVSNLGRAYKVYEAAENVRDGFTIVSQFWLTGTIDPILIASLISNIGPFDKIIKGMKRVGNVVEGLSETMTGFYRTAVRKLGPQKAAQVVGELSADFAAKAYKLHPTDFPVRYHGIDRVYKKGNHYYILEAKGGTGQLTPPQMSRDWINRKIRGLEQLGTPEGTRWAKTLRQARDEGRLSGMLVETRIPNEIVNDPVVTIRSWAEIGTSEW